MKLLAFAASSSQKSINKQLVTYAASLLTNYTVEIADLNDYELPIFSVDKEAQLGQPDLAQAFMSKINDAEALIISFAEHNGSYTAAYKNLFDWCSRIEAKVYKDKPMILLSTSPGAGGANSVLNAAINSMPHFGGTVKGSFSLPKFYDNFDSDNNRIMNNELALELQNVVKGLNT
ncbi:MAG: NADPH-dependent FMN reductase [Marinicellaceae bacterium]